jgi:hypothetical protein
MSQFQLTQRSIPLDDSYDVIVVGGGPAGCTAATASAREGARTLLIEAEGALGGMGTLGLVPWFCGYNDGERNIHQGLAERVRLGLSDGIPHLGEEMKDNQLATPAIDPEVLKRIYDDMVTESGAHVLFHTRLSSVECDDDGQAETLIISNKAGISALRANVYVDTTGDGDLAAWAGATVEKGDDKGDMQPATHCFVIANIDEEALARGPRVHFYDPESPIHDAIASEKYPDIIEPHSCTMKSGPGILGFNTGHVFGVDNTDPRSVSDALFHGRKMARQYRDALTELHPAFRNSFLATTGSLLGVRETRRVVGDYYLTLDDYMERRSFDDEICRSSYNIDVHSSKERTLEITKKSIDEIKKANEKQIKSYERGDSFGVPYRCLTPKGLTNTLVAGRCISSDRQLNGSVRIMACCLSTGEAAGTAAAMAVSGNGDVHAVNTDALRDTLKRHGQYLPEPTDTSG